MLDETMKTQLKGYLERVVRPIEIAARAAFRNPHQRASSPFG